LVDELKKALSLCIFCFIWSQQQALSYWVPNVTRKA